MSIQNLIDQVNGQTFTYVEENMKQVKAEDLGMDPRAGYRLYIDDECVAVDAENDRSLQYYGGFEYVDKEYRTEMGGYVFYFCEDSRVQDCLDCQAETE
jgi:hypothetical protein